MLNYSIELNLKDRVIACYSVILYSLWVTEFNTQELVLCVTPSLEKAFPRLATIENATGRPSL